MYDPKEDEKLINDLKELINEKWNTFAESESFYTKDYNTTDDSYTTDFGLPIHIGKLDKNEKKKLELNKYKNVHNKIDIKLRKNITKANVNNNKYINNESDDEDNEGRVAKMLKSTGN